MKPTPTVPFRGRDEGQHFGRKSILEGVDDEKRARDRQEHDQTAGYGVGFASTQPEVPILGIEDANVVARGDSHHRRQRSSAGVGVDVTPSILSGAR